MPIKKNHNMILSPGASVESLPKLEIGTDEVKCAHGAAISPVDKNQLYYLSSRGIREDEATTMIVNGFSEPVLRAIPHESLRTLIRAFLNQKKAA